MTHSDIYTKILLTIIAGALSFQVIQESGLVASAQAMALLSTEKPVKY